MPDLSPTPSIASQVSRRRFLRKLGVATGCVASAATLAGCEVAEVKTSGGGNVTSVAFDLSDATYAPLKTMGGMVAVNAGSTKLLLIRSHMNTVVALSRICPHAGCDLSPDAVGKFMMNTQHVRCGCHNSEFKTDGAYVAGSLSGGGTVGDLASFPVTFDPATGQGSVDLAGVA